MPALRLIGFALVWVALIAVALETVRAERGRSTLMGAPAR